MQSDSKAVARLRSMFIANTAMPLSTNEIRFIALRNARRNREINHGLIPSAVFAALVFGEGLIKGEAVDFAAQ